MNPGAWEQASFTETTIVISPPSISAEHCGYLARTACGVLGIKQLRVIIRSGTNSPI